MNDNDGVAQLVNDREPLMTGVVRIFISGTNGDLETEKSKILDLLNSSQHYKCTAPGLQGPIDAAAIEGCKHAMLSCDIYLGLIGRRRGEEVAIAECYRSITEIEYDYARELNIPRLVWMPLDTYPRPASPHEGEEKFARQTAFRERVREERIFGSRAQSVEALATEAVLAVSDIVIATRIIQKLRPDLLSASDARGDNDAVAATNLMAMVFDTLRQGGMVDELEALNSFDHWGLDTLANFLSQSAQKLVAGTSTTVEHKRLAANLFRGVGLIAAMVREHDGIKPLRAAAELCGDDPEIWNELGTLLDRTGHSREAAEAFQLVYLKAGELKLKAWQATGAMNYGLAMIDEDVDVAEQWFHFALQIAKSLGNQRRILDCQGNLALVQSRRGNHIEARRIREDCLRSEEDHGTPQGQAAELAGLGSICIRLDDLQAARAYVSRGKALDKKLGNVVGEAENLILLGIIDRKERYLNRSIVTFDLAIAVLEPRGIRESLARAYMNKGRSYQLLANWPEARRQLNFAWQLELALFRYRDAARTAARLIDCIARGQCEHLIEPTFANSLASLDTQDAKDEFVKRCHVAASKLAADDLRDGARSIWRQILECPDHQRNPEIIRLSEACLASF